MKIDFNGYITRQWKKSYKDGIGRNWFLVKRTIGNQGYVRIGYLSIPEEYVGKRIRLKMEVMDNGKVSTRSAYVPKKKKSREKS